MTLNGRSRDGVEHAVARLAARAGGARIDGIAADAATAEGAAAIVADLPRADILVNNLGIFELKPFFDIPDADGGASSSQRAEPRAPRAAYAAGQRAPGLGAHSFSSRARGALNIPREMTHYGMTKTAQLAVSRGLARSSSPPPASPSTPSCRARP